MLFLWAKKQVCQKWLIFASFLLTANWGRASLRQEGGMQKLAIYVKFDTKVEKGVIGCALNKKGGSLGVGSV